MAEVPTIYHEWTRFLGDDSFLNLTPLPPEKLDEDGGYDSSGLPWPVTGRYVALRDYEALRSALTAAESERDAALAMVAALREVVAFPSEELPKSITKKDGQHGLILKGERYTGVPVDFIHEFMSMWNEVSSKALADTAAAAQAHDARKIAEGMEKAAEIADQFRCEYNSPSAKGPSGPIQLVSGNEAELVAACIRFAAAKTREGE